MIAAQKQDLVEFVGFSVDAFSRWLRVGLEGLYIDGLGVRNFKPLEYCILREHSLAADLQNIYREFPSQQQASIRIAIARLIERLPAEPRFVPIFRDLIDFAVLVGAHEIFNVLPANGEGFLIIEQDHPELPSLYQHSINAVIELSDRSQEAEECIRRLIGTPGSFDFRHARTALVALCKIAPKKFIEHVNLLREPLARNFASFRPTVGALTYLAEDIMKAVGLGIVEESWSKLRVTNNPEINKPNDNWFCESTISLLSKIRVESNAEIIYVSSDPDVRIEVPRRPIGNRSGISAYRRMPSPDDQPFQDAPSKYPALLADQITPEERAANEQSVAVLFRTVSPSYA